jgi:hypothetical protein
VSAAIQVLSHEGLLAERAARIARGDLKPVRSPKFKMPMSRLVTTSEGLSALADKIRIDVNEGREQVPLLYGPIYQTLNNSNFPRIVSTNLFSTAAVVFLQRVEGGEAYFGHTAPNTEGTVPIVNYSAGLEWTREMVMYDETWTAEERSRAVGEAYNALLNHLHLGPILSYSYAAANQTAADATGATAMEKWYNTLDNALQTAALAKRPGTVLLASSANRRAIERAVGGYNDSVGNVFSPLSEVSTVIYYDGWTVTVGPKTYTYSGVTAGKAYLIQPRRRFRELVKVDFDVVPGNPDVSRGIEDQVIWHTDRGVYSDIANSVEEITWPV